MQAKIEGYAKTHLKDEMAKEMKRADRLADLVMDFSTNGQGQELANVQNSAGFQDVYDYRGGLKSSWRLDRKREWVAAQYDAKSQLFQKVFYAKDLVLEDERELRAAFFNAESAFNMQR